MAGSATKASAAVDSAPDRASGPVAASQRSPYHHGDLRNALIVAARDIARASGPDAVTLRAAARDAGVSHAAAYKHFADKDDVLRAIAVRAFEDLDVVLQRLLADGDPGLEEIGVTYLRFAVDAPAEFRFMFRRELCMPEGVPDPLEDAGRAVQSRLTDRISELQRDGRLATGDTAAVSMAAWALMHGVATIVLETPVFKTAPPEAAEQVMRRSFSSLVAGIGPHPEFQGGPSRRSRGAHRSHDVR